MPRESGFTLIELLLVLAIIGIITAIAVPTLLFQQEKAKRASLQDQTISVLAELTSVLGELSDPPSERKPWFPTSIYNGSASDNQAKATDAIKLVLARGNFANARNPYSGARGAYIAADVPAGTGGTVGLIYLDASTANTTLDPIITVGGKFRDSNGNIRTLIKTVAVN